jgi:hypothetical protein
MGSERLLEEEATDTVFRLRADENARGIRDSTEVDDDEVDDGGQKCDSCQLSSTSSSFELCVWLVGVCFSAAEACDPNRMTNV